MLTNARQVTIPQFCHLLPHQFNRGFHQSHASTLSSMPYPTRGLQYQGVFRFLKTLPLTFAGRPSELYSAERVTPYSARGHVHLCS